MFEQLGSSVLRAIRQAVGRMLRVGLLGLLGLLLGALLMEVVGIALGDGWPPRLLTHLAAVAVGVTLAYALAVTIALVEGVRGLVSVADKVDDVARAATSAGVNALDAVVDAVDGPDRHGFLGVPRHAEGQRAARGRRAGGARAAVAEVEQEPGASRYSAESARRTMGY